MVNILVVCPLYGGRPYLVMGGFTVTSNYINVLPLRFTCTKRE